MRTLAEKYTDGIVAIGNPDVGLRLLDQMKKETSLQIQSLISPRAYVAPSETIAEGTVVEPLAVIHTKCCIGRGCLVSAGAVVSHESICHEGVYMDCTATISGYSEVLPKRKVSCGMVFETCKELLQG